MKTYLVHTKNSMEFIFRTSNLDKDGKPIALLRLGLVWTELK